MLIPVFFACLLSIAASFSAPQSEESVPALAITHVSVIPVNRPGLLKDQTVIVVGDSILSIGPAEEVALPEGAIVVDGRGRFLIPGLADMHEHLPRGDTEWENSLEDYFDYQLAAGVTTIRTMRGAPEDIAMRNSVISGALEGPRFIIGSPGLNSRNAPDPQTARTRVKEYQAAGFDFIKLLGGFDSEVFDAITDAGIEFNIPVGGHLPRSVSLDHALQKSLWSLEHLHGHSAAWRESPEGFPEVAKATKEAGLWVCPTLGFQYSWYNHVDVETMMKWPGMEYAHPGAIEDWSKEAAEHAVVDQETAERYALTFKSLHGAVRDLADAGVDLLVSSSGGWFLVPGFSMHVEFDCLSNAGLTPQQLLQAATLNAARSIGEGKEWGSIQPGMAADMVLLNANPLTDIQNATQIEAVIRHGVLHDRKDLDGRLQRIVDNGQKEFALAETEKQLSEKWPTSSPEAQGIDSEAIMKLDARARSGEMGLVDSMLIIRNQKVIFQSEYNQDYSNWKSRQQEPAHQYNYFHTDWHPFYKGTKLHTMQSVSKSVTSLVIGIAIYHGDIESTDVPVLSFFPEFKAPDPDGRKAKIRLEDVLTMRSGFEWDEWSFGINDPRNDCIQLEASDNWIEFVLNKPMAEEPGEVFVYNSGSTHLLSGIIKKATGKTIDAYAEEFLFKPLGIQSFHWKKSPQGLPDTEGGLYLLPTDLAKLGLLCLKDGMWQGKRILPEGWIERSVTPWVKDINPNNNFRDPGYGYKWWIMNDGKNGEAKIYAARGFGGQTLLVVPKLDVIAVFTGWNIEGRTPPISMDFIQQVLPSLR